MIPARTVASPIMDMRPIRHVVVDTKSNNTAVDPESLVGGRRLAMDSRQFNCYDCVTDRQSGRNGNKVLLNL